jgi:hypothetical protein
MSNKILTAVFVTFICLPGLSFFIYESYTTHQENILVDPVKEAEYKKFKERVEFFACVEKLPDGTDKYRKPQTITQEEFLTKDIWCIQVKDHRDHFEIKVDKEPGIKV